jgi:hypothetical protein
LKAPDIGRFQFKMRERIENRANPTCARFQIASKASHFSLITRLCQKWIDDLHPAHDDSRLQILGVQYRRTRRVNDQSVPKTNGPLSREATM